MVILANIVAYLFILTALGFFVAIGFMVLAGFQYYRVAKRVIAMVNRPKNAGMQIFRAGRGAVLRDAAHISAIGASGRSAVKTILTTKDEILGSARSIDVDGAREAATNARDAIAGILSTATLALQLAKQIMGLVSQARPDDSGSEAA